MASFPASIVSIPDPTSSNSLNSPPHATQHATVNDEIVAVETKIGTGASTPAANTVLQGTGAGVSAWQPLTTDGWSASSDTFVYNSASSFKITGVDKTAIYTKGTRIKLTNNSITFYGTVYSSTFSTDTLVTLFANNDFSLANSAITNPFYSYAENPQGYPGRFAYTPSYSASSGTYSAANTAYFSVSGRTCLVSIFSDGTTSVSTQELLVTLPVSAAGNQGTAIQCNDGGGLINANAYVLDTLNLLHVNRYDGSAFGAGVSRTIKTNFPFFY